MQVGAPMWTVGQFQRVSAQDDLGMESVGAGLLRRLIPGVVQTTPNAGYYAFYPYLLSKWETHSESSERGEFKPFYRRQEAAYALACVLHDHRGDLFGVQGSNKAADALREAGDELNVAALADVYMDSPYGGYGLFYARVLEDMQLTVSADRAAESRGSAHSSPQARVVCHDHRPRPLTVTAASFAAQGGPTVYQPGTAYRPGTASRPLSGSRRARRSVLIRSGSGSGTSLQRRRLRGAHRAAVCGRTRLR